MVRCTFKLLQNKMIFALKDDTCNRVFEFLNRDKLSRFHCCWFF